MRKAIALCAVGAATLAGGPVTGEAPLVLTPVTVTAPLYNYEDAPATPDADDPAVWVDRRNPRRSLVIGTAKDAGLLVYDLAGVLRQALLPPNAPHVGPADPPTPAGLNPLPDNPCPGSTSGETFGRFNNVDVLYDVPLGSHRGAPRVDVAAVSDRGCDRVRFYRIDPLAVGGPLIDITAGNVPRVFPARYEQPSPLQPSGAVEGWRDNPVDDQNTVYGLTALQGENQLFVTQRERGLVRQLQVVPAAGGRLTYETGRTFLFRTSFDLTDEASAPYSWTPCREAALEEPQSEGLVVDRVNDTLYVAFETIGLYKVPLRPWLPRFVTVTGSRLIEPVKSFGRPYHATLDDDEFECEYDAEGDPEPGVVVAVGSDANAGQHLEADAEGLTILASIPGRVLLLASSQGDSSFHVYQIGSARAIHRGEFFVDGVGETDGVHYAPVPMGRQYPLGLLVVQNGDAPDPPDTGDVGGYEFDGATQFKFVSIADALPAVLRP